MEAVLEEHMWGPPRVFERYAMLSSTLAGKKRRAHGLLSSRQREIVGLLERRLCNKEIGEGLGISERTVRFHLQNVFDKLGVRDRVSVAELARTTGLAEAEPRRGRSELPRAAEAQVVTRT